VAGHTVELEHLRHGADDLREPREPSFRMVLGLDRHEHGHAKPELVLVDHGDPLLDHAVALEPLDALPARRRGKADPIADLGDRERGVLLEDSKNFPVDGVHAGALPRCIRMKISGSANIENKYSVEKAKFRRP